MSRVDTFLEMVVRQNGSDLHLVAGNSPRLRLHGEVYSIKYRKLTPQETLELIYEIMNEAERRQFEQNCDLDFSYEVAGLARFRVNVLQHYGGIGAVFRVIPSQVKTLDDLGLPPVLKKLARLRKGLILVTGSTGSGKSTTLAAMVDFINTQRNGHIITIEDPVEFIHHNQKCLISQREVGPNTKTFASALRSALREDPDVILVGEMRDLETIGLAVTAAEMGILVMATLHTSGAATTVDRIINTFSAGEQSYIRSMLSTSLCGIISQELIRKIDKKSRTAILEILINNPASSNLIREGKTDQIDNVIQSGALQGMQSYDNSLRQLLDAKVISQEDAFLKARNKSAIKTLLEQTELDENDSIISDQEISNI